MFNAVFPQRGLGTFPSWVNPTKINLDSIATFILEEEEVNVRVSSGCPTLYT